MRQTESFPRSSLLVPVITIVSIFALVLGIGAARKGGSGPKKQDGTPHMQSITPRVQNKTRSFEITQARRNQDIAVAGPELSLRNGYDKNITAYAVSVNGLVGTVDFVYSESEDQRAITPGASHTRGFSYVRRSINRAVAGREDFDINILAVVFDDKTGDGDEKTVASIFNERLKSKQLMTRIVDLLSGDLNAGRNPDDTNFVELRSRILSLSSDPNDTSDINDVLRWLDQSDHGLSTSERIIRVKAICENFVARL